MINQDFINSHKKMDDIVSADLREPVKKSLLETIVERLCYATSAFAMIYFGICVARYFGGW